MIDHDRQLRAILDIGNSSRDGVVIFDVSQNQLTFCNTIAEEITGLKTGDHPSAIQRLLSKIPAEDHQYLRGELAKLHETFFSEVECQLDTNEQQIRHLCIVSHLIFDEQMIVAFIKDITDAKQHESYMVEFGMKKNTMMDAVTHHLSGALSLMGQLASSASKHFRNDNADAVRTSLALLQENSKHCLNVINQLVTEEHERSPRVSVIPVRFHVEERLNFLLEELRPSYPNRTFELISPGDVTILHSDEFKILQVINVFIANAIKFSEAATVITTAIAEDKESVIISVSDHGIGIPETLKPFVFDRNTSAKRAGLHGEISNGLGLSLTKELAHLLKGKVWFTSEEGKGSTFYLSIPKDSKQ